MKKKSFRRWIWIGVILMIIAALVVSAFWMLGVPNGWKLSGLLRDSLSRESFDGDLTVAASVQDNEMEFQTEVFRRTSDNLTLHGVSVGGIPICFANHRVIFDNGRAFDLGDLLPENAIDTDRLLKMLPFAGVKKASEGEDTVYSLQLDSSKLQKIFPDLPDTSSLAAEFTEHDGAVSKLHIHFDDGIRQTEITLCFVPERLRELPAEVWNGATAEDVQSLEAFSPLANALIGLSRADPLGAELEVTADCGPIALSDTMMLYRTDSGLYLQRNDTISHLQALDLSNPALLGLGYKFCRDGRVSRVGTSGTYSLTIPAESVKAWCVEMLPEIEVLPITYEDASLLFEVKDNALFHVKMDVSGRMPFLLTTIDIALGVGLHPIPSEQVVLPEGVR